MRMVCIGPGPGPKNVLAEDDNGHRVVVPYRIWKFKLKPKEAPVEKQYISTIGIVQQFKKDGVLQPLFRTNETNGGTVHNVTIKTITQQKLVSVALFGEYAELIPHIKKGGLLSVEGSYTVSDDGKYVNITPYEVAYVAPVARIEREVVNAQPQAEQAAAPQAAASSGSPF